MIPKNPLSPSSELDLENSIQLLDWNNIGEGLQNRGFALVTDFLPLAISENLKSQYSETKPYRKTVNMKRYRFGLGEYKYYSYPLPSCIQKIRESLYAPLAQLANSWREALKLTLLFPENHSEFLEICHKNNQSWPTPLLLKYEPGGYNALHQDLYGEVFFPFQVAIFLNSPQEDFLGGEFVLTEQVPRAQTKAVVLQPQKGDLLFFATQFRPEKGLKGYFRVNIKHGVSEIFSGERYTLGIIFHDAKS